MTAGGNYAPEEYGFGYVRAMAQGYYGIGDVKLIQAVGLDIEGADVIKYPHMTLTDKAEITHGDVREDETILCGISWMT